MNICISIHVVRNPQGQQIQLPKFVISRLCELGAIATALSSGLDQITSAVYGLFPILEIPDHHHQPLRAQPFCRSPRHSGHPNRVLLALGKDIQGVTTWVDCDCPECIRVEEEADRTAFPHGKGRA